MREIKFRFWNKEINQFTHGSHFDESDIEEPYKYFGEHIIVMQYTGLKDKNGKEIYEGDKVNGFYHDNSGGYQGEVRFEQGGFCTEYSALANYSRLEVIGNIYENGDLLK